MRSRTVSLAKITRPVPGEVFERNRLFRLLDSKRRRPIVWVSGPPGSGKTTLLSSYIDSRKLPCIWYQMDAGDSDVATFFYYMGLAAKKVSPRRKPLPLLTPEYQMGGIHAFTRRYFEALFSKLKVPFVIVFDNYQETSPLSPIHTVMREGLSCIPSGINVIILSRDNLPKELLRLKLNTMISHITWEDLRLIPEESEGIINMRKEVPEEVVKTLHERASGWVAALVLMVEALKKEHLKHPYLKKAHTYNEIFDYFASEVFDRADPEIQDFLLKTSLLPSMTVKMASAITRSKDSAEILSSLYQKNYFITRRPGADNAYQYHPLFREFLQSHAHSTYTPGMLLSLRQRAADLLQKAGEAEEAARLYIKSEDWEGLSGLIMKQAEELIMQGRNQVLEEWLRSIPEEVFNTTPWLLYWYGMCRLPFEPRKSLSYFEQTFREFLAQKDHMGMFMSCFSAIDAILYEQADFKLLDSWISVLESLFSSELQFPSREAETRAISSMFISLLLRQPHHPRIEEWAERVLSSSRPLKDPNIRIFSEVDVSLYYQWTGLFAKAEEVIAPLRNLARQEQTSPLAFTTLKAFEAMYYSLKGMHQSCLTVVSDGLKVARSTGVNTMLYQILTHGAASCLGAGDIDRAEELLDEASRITDDSQRMNIAYYHYLMAWKHLLLDDLLSASEHITIALDLVLRVGFPFMEAMFRHGMAQILFEQGEYKKATRNLAMALQIGRNMKSHMIEYMCLLSRAYFSLKQGKEYIGIRYLKQAMAEGKKHGFIHFLYWRPSVMAGLCARALEQGIENEYVCELVRKRNLVPDTPPLDLECWPWPVRIYTLGHFSLVVNGRPVRFTRKAQQKPLALLKTLITFGGQGVSTGRIIDALWPDTLGDAALSSFTTTLQRLRKILGNNEAVVVSQGKVTLNPLYCWVDAWAFERLISRCETVMKDPEKTGTRKVISLCEKVMGMYNGHFLGEDTELYWSVSMRERLRNRLLRHIMNTGHYLQNRRELKRAVELYQKGLDIEPLAEELYQQLMNCYGRLGYYGEVERVYRRCLDVLSSILGVDPSPETMAIYQESTNPASKRQQH